MKEFLKLTKGKIILALILLIIPYIFLFHLCIPPQYEEGVAYAQVVCYNSYPILFFFSSAGIEFSIGASFIFTLIINIIISYVVSCLIISIFKRK